MIFTTLHFLVFFIIVMGLYFLLPKSWRPTLLLVSSYYFYMCAIPAYITVIIFITIIDYVAGLQIAKAQTQKKKKLFLILSLLSNFGLLIAFKYLGFFAVNLNRAFGISLPVWNFILPLGISFHTFQAVSYTIEVYRGKYPAERNFMAYAIYVAFFPQMVAGPIERPANLLPQIHVDHKLSYDNMAQGFRIALWGLFKKMVLADLISKVVSTVYAHPRQFSGPILILATFFFSVQIYCDFSGYSDIAIGVARMMGFRLMTNFRQPYFAKSIGEFWHRWHISLSTWFRDYLYFPLGGNRVSRLRNYANVMIVFLVSGLWHGANWTFAIWGGLHGAYLVLGMIFKPLRGALKARLGLREDGALLGGTQMLVTFSLATFAWIFFRANTLDDAHYIITHLATLKDFHASDLFEIGLPPFELMLSFLLIGVVGWVEWLIAHDVPRISELWVKRPFRWSCYFACVFATLFFGVFEKVEFIYFQF